MPYRVNLTQKQKGDNIHNMELIKKEVVPAQVARDKRLPRMVKLRESGYTLQRIGDIYGISRQRVEQILSKRNAEIVIYHYQCKKCKQVESSYRKSPHDCLSCLVASKASKHKNRQQLRDFIYKNEPEWRQQGRELTRHKVRFRDKFTCQSCGSVRTPEEVRSHNKKLKTGKGKIKMFDVHHLGGKCGKKSKGYDNAKDMDTLVTLCHKCHYNHPEHTIQRKNKVVHTPVLSS